MAKVKEVLCALCKEKTSDIVRYNNKNYHPACVEIKQKNETEHIEWMDLCSYVHKSIMGYTEKMLFPKHISLRLRGLQEGKFMANSKSKPNANYSFKSIHYTFMAKRLDIISSCGRIVFRDDKNKFNYIMAIIENSINEIVLKMDKVAENNNKLDNLEISDLQLVESTPMSPEIVEEKKPENKIAEKFKNLW